MVDERPCYFVYNDQVALDILESVTDIAQSDYVIISYHLASDILLMHPTLVNAFSKKEALEDALYQIEHYNIHSFKNDAEIRRKLNDPMFSTKKTLAYFLRNELEDL